MTWQEITRLHCLCLITAVNRYRCQASHILLKFLSQGSKQAAVFFCLGEFLQARSGTVSSFFLSFYVYICFGALSYLYFPFILFYIELFLLSFFLSVPFHGSIQLVKLKIENKRQYD